MNKLSPWQYAVTVRFFSQNFYHPARQIVCPQLISELSDCSLIDKGHPWQLITFNLGMIALSFNMIEVAAKFFKKSIEICFSPASGPTISVMALLPISMVAAYSKKTNKREMERIISGDHGKWEIWEKHIQRAAKYLSKDHFLFLSENRFDKSLEILNKSPQSVFPFSYR